mmetsp:Transcript_27984/g.64589  ORF Transcript_27984/g.64589 Transcript_27984/m.64589 type:complete len:586 (+) Transcript_27984:80-1837(+)
MKLLFSCLVCLASLGTIGAERPHFDHLRRSVVRIQAVSSSFNWLQPFFPGEDQVGLGSGFVVQTEPYPIFATNEHVVNDAKVVTLQLLLYGEHRWVAKVVSVCPKFDLALLVLEDSEGFSEAMKSSNITLEKLAMAERVASMGEDVMALGFPLGQDALKISKGNIAGNEDVDGNICIQSTAPISPGSSGGPLLNSDGSEVLGVNFAKATEGENINYVIPAWRVSQLLRKHLTDQPAQNASDFQRLLVQVPLPDLTTIEGNDALYKMSGGCQSGVWVSKVGHRSFLSHASPEVADHFFLVSVGGVQLDKFGMGLQPDYVADRVFYSDLFYMFPDLNSNVTFETCSGGTVRSHKAALNWLSEYGQGIRFVSEPTQQGFSSAYEIFGDISVMELTVNHISVFVNEHGNPGPARWLHPDAVTQPRLVVNFVQPGTYVSNILSAGAVVTSVNGKPVSTLSEFKGAFIPEKEIWTLETDMGKIAALFFGESLVSQLTQSKTPGGQYLLTPSVQGAAEKLGLKGFHTASTAEPEGQVQKLPVHSKALLSQARKHDSARRAPMERAAGPVEVVASSKGTGQRTKHLAFSHLDI